MLALETKPRVDSKKDFAPASSNAGPLKQFTSDEFAFHLVQCGSCIGVDYFPQAVVIQRLAFQDLSLSQVLVKGSFPDFTPIIVTMSPEEKDDQLIGAEDEDADEPEIDPPGLHSVSECDDDLLAMVLGSKPQPKQRGTRGRKGKTKPSTSAEFRKSFLDKALNQTLAEEDEVINQGQGEKPVVYKQLLNLIGDPAVVDSLDESSAKSLLDAFNVCKEREKTFDAEATFDVEESDQEEVTVSEEVVANTDESSVQELQATVPQHAASSSSDVDLLAGKTAPSTSIQETVMARREDGSVVKLLHFKNPLHGKCPYEIRRVHANGISTAVGRVHVMISARTETYKATCSIHRGCQCWVTRVDSTKLQKLFEWLVAGIDATQDMHEKLSKELRQSFGIKIRS